MWNGDRVAEERDEKGVLQAVYEHGQELGPLRLRRLKDNLWQNRFFVGDGQDSTRQLMNEAGVVTDSYFYDSFGNGLNGGQGQTINPFKYTGQQQDESGLYYLRARYYNAGTGRFLSHDPLMGSGSDPISMHRYLYAGDDPANGVDPTGRETCAEMCTSICINMALTAGRNAVLGAAFGGVVGAGVAAGDSFIQGGTPSDIVNAEIHGAIQGAKFGALGSIRVLQIPMLLWGAFQTGQSVGSALAQGNNGLAAYRLGTFIALLGAAKFAHESPSPANTRSYQIAENQFEQSSLEAQADEVYVETGATQRFIKYNEFERADEFYEQVRQTDDVGTIARNLGIDEAYVARVKNHLFFKIHQLRYSEGRFDADPDIANSWKRFQEGDFNQNDLELFEHELMESYYISVGTPENPGPTTYDTAHNAVKEDYPWEVPHYGY